MTRKRHYLDMWCWSIIADYGSAIESVTYIKAFDIIRELFASLPEAKKRGFPAGIFLSMCLADAANLPSDGTVTVEMQFLADVELVCDEMQRHALQAAGAGNPLQRQEHSRGI